MKTYRIKPIELKFDDDENRYKAIEYTIELDMVSCEKFNAYEKHTFRRIYQGTLDECKAACQAHLESKILPYLEES